MQARPATDRQRGAPVEIAAALATRIGLDAFMQHRERLVPAGLATTLVLVATVSAFPVASPAPVSAGTPPSRAPRVEILGPQNPGYDVVDPVLPDEAAGSTEGEIVDGTLANVSHGSRAALDATKLEKSYTVQPGDTAVGIAANFGISVTTLYWANKSVLKDPQSIWPGQVLAVPPANGLILTVGENDTLETLAQQYGTTVQAIVETNNLADPILIAGDTLFIPGARGDAMPTPKPIPTPKSGGGTTPRQPSGGTTPRYTGGRLVWPVAGRGYVSQYFWSGHPAVDIAAQYGTRVVAAGGGTVIYAGWRSYSGGGNVVWISHGGKLYTTYNHLSRWTVGAGQYVSAGQTIGAIGLSGVTTGPHLHFEVWTAYPWSHGTLYGIQNPCRYLGC